MAVLAHILANLEVIVVEAAAPYSLVIVRLVLDDLVGPPGSMSTGEVCKVVKFGSMWIDIAHQSRVGQIHPIAANPIPGICGMGFVGLVGLAGLVGLSLIN